MTADVHHMRDYDRLRPARAALADDATVVDLPVIRIERHDEPAELIPVRRRRSLLGDP